MITFDKLWITMNEKSVSTYRLREDYGFNSKTISKLRKNENVNTSTLNKLCKILQCELSDIASYEEDEK